MCVGTSLFPFPQLGHQLEQPGQPIRTFEGRPSIAAEIPDFGLDVLGGEAAVQRPARVVGKVGVADQAHEPRQQPVRVHRRVPVVAPEERGGQLARWSGIVVGMEHVPDLVGVLPVDTVEGEAGKAAGRLRVQRAGLRRHDCRSETRTH